jgi:hypothetical protein
MLAEKMQDGVAHNGAKVEYEKRASGRLTASPEVSLQ